MPEQAKEAAEESETNKRVFRHQFEFWTASVRTAKHDSLHGTRLVFESDYVVRSVRDFPVNWQELTDAELYLLSWRR